MKVAIDGVFTLKFDVPQMPEVGQRIDFLETMDLIPAGSYRITEIGECITAEGTYPLLILDVELPWRSL